MKPYSCYFYTTLCILGCPSGPFFCKQYLKNALKNFSTLCTSSVIPTKHGPESLKIRQCLSITLSQKTSQPFFLILPDFGQGLPVVCHTIFTYITISCPVLVHSSCCYNAPLLLQEAVFEKEKSIKMNYLLPAQHQTVA